MLTRSSIGLLLLITVLLIAAGCRQQTAVPPEPIFPSGSQTVAADDPTLKAPEPPPAPPEPAAGPEMPAPEEETSTEQPATTPATGKWQPPTQAEIDAARKAGTRQAVIKTAGGDIEVELYGKETPITVANFVKLAKAKFYDGLVFHRVLADPEFSIAQGGDPKGDGTGGPGYQIKREIAPELKHVTGALAMARSTDPDSAGSQFYICRVAIPNLDKEYAVFGKVVKGLDVAKKIEQDDKIINIRIK
jgi:cyclophilin family peptidyl-prolyl cis-trans isomerase